MKVNTAIAALGGTMFIAAGANAAFVGVGWEEIDNTNPNVAIDRTIDFLAVLGSGSGDVIGQADRRVSARRLLGTISLDLHREGIEGNPTLLENHDHVDPHAGTERKKERLSW